MITLDSEDLLRSFFLGSWSIGRLVAITSDFHDKLLVADTGRLCVIHQLGVLWVLGVCLHVGSQIRTLREPLTATRKFAHVWFFTSMDTHMGLEVESMREPPLADFSFMRLAIGRVLAPHQRHLLSLGLCRGWLRDVLWVYLSQIYWL